MPTFDPFADERLANERSLRNAIFLIEAQMRTVSQLVSDGNDAREARAMLRKFMKLEATLRARAEAIADAGAPVEAVA